MEATFKPTFLDFIWKPDNDGQGEHVTPGDPGAATSWGVPLSDYNAYRRKLRLRPLTLPEFAALPQSAFEPVYRTEIWDAVHGDELPSGVDLIVANFACGAGPHRAIVLLQRALGVAEDGVIGPKTMEAARFADPAALIKRYSLFNDVYYESLETFAEFGKGWLRRAADAEALALKLAGAD